MSGRDSTIGDGRRRLGGGWRDKKCQGETPPSVMDRRRLGGGWRDKKCQGETPPSVMAEEGLVVDGETRSVRERLHHR